MRTFLPEKPEHRAQTFLPDDPLPKPEAGDVMLLCGAHVLAALQKAGLAPKNKGLEAMRETAIPHNGGHYLVTYAPDAVHVRPELAEVMGWDIRLAHRLMKSGSLKPQVGKYVWVSSYLQLISEIEAEYAKTGRPVKVSMDTETMGLYPWYKDKDIVSISFTHRPGVSQLLYFGPRREPRRSTTPHPCSTSSSGS
jgi:hypothetical protein